MKRRNFLKTLAGLTLVPYISAPVIAPQTITRIGNAPGPRKIMVGDVVTIAGVPGYFLITALHAPPLRLMI